MKLNIKLTALLLCAVLLAACTGTGGSVQNDISGENAEGGQSTAGTPAPAGEATQTQGYGKLRMIGHGSWNLNSANGYYYQLDRVWVLKEGAEIQADAAPDNDDYIYYSNIYCTNFTTRQKSILCSAAGCLHDSENCTSYVIGNQTYFLEAGGQILVMSNNPDASIKTVSNGENSDITVSIMDYDGQNRRELLKYNSDIETSFTWFTDDECLYFINVTPAEPLPEPNEESYLQQKKRWQRTLMRFNLETGDVAELYQMNSVAEYPLGVLGDEMLFKLTEFPEDIYDYENDWEKWMEIEMQGVCKIIAVDKTTGAARTLEKEYPYYNMAPKYVEDGWFYYAYNRPAEEGLYHPYPQAIYRDNLATGQTETVIDGGETQGFYMSDPIADGNIFISVVEDVNSPEEGTLPLCWMPAAGGEMTPITLFAEMQDYGMYEDGTYVKRAITPLADAGDYFFVMKDSLSSEEDGDVRMYALILKEDYWANNPNFIPITIVE